MPDSSQNKSAPNSASSNGSGCPVDHAPAPHESGCPVNHDSLPSFAQSLPGTTTTTTNSNSSAQCPVNHATNTNGEEINPLNMMPTLPQEMHPSQQQQLSTDREYSTIPRATDKDDAEVWEYPSPQQFYNALARKNMAAPEEYIDSMVDIHNFLNEGAWNEVLKWESNHSKECMNPRLIRLQGRPRDLSPMARFRSWVYGVRPFDRHDWYVDRCGKQVRYVIDYYEGAPDDGMPVFNLVVRPAVDDFGGLADRLGAAWLNAKERYFGSGGQK